MAIKKTDDQNYHNIADAIRIKNDEKTLYKPHEMASAIEAIPGKCFIATIESDVSNDQAVMNTYDPIIAAHRNDPNFVVGIMALNDTSSSSIRGCISGNACLANIDAAVYGSYIRNSTVNVSMGVIKFPPTTRPRAIEGLVTVDADGIIQLYAGRAYPLRAGNYMVVCGWGSTT